MFKKMLTLAVISAGLLIPTLSDATTTDSGDITITATVETYFEWDSANVLAIDKDAGWTGGTGVSASHIGKPGDVIQATHVLTVNTNADASFQISAVANGGVLTEAGTGTKLKTSYMLTTGTLGAIVGPGFLDAEGAGVLGAFDAANAWALTHDAAGQSNLNLEVKAEIPAGITLPAAADYTCQIKITATW